MFSGTTFGASAFAVAIAAAFCSPVAAGELGPVRYQVTVLAEARAARAIAVLEAQRFSSSLPSWSPAPPMAKGHVCETIDFNVIAIEPQPAPTPRVEALFDGGREQ